MRAHRLPRIVYASAATAASAGLWAVSPALAATAAPVAPAAPTQGGVGTRVCLEPGIRFGESPNAPSVVVRAIPGGGLPAGRYRVSATTSDAYAGRSETPPEIETSERVMIYGSPTEDLADGVEADTKTLVIEVTFATAQTSVEVAHIPVPGHPDSVRVDQICWERLDDPGATTTTPTTVASSVATPTSAQSQQTATSAGLIASTTTTSPAAASTTAAPGLGLNQPLPTAPPAPALAIDPDYTG